VAVSVVWHGFRDALLMAWEVWWALVFGFAISAVVQAWVPRERIEARLGGRGAGPLARATALGAASSSCSYAAVAIAKNLFEKGASAASALAFQVASTNLVWELGLVLWTLIGWQFALAEYAGGLVMIALLALALALLASPAREQRARAYALRAETGHRHETATGRPRIRSVAAWSDVAHNFRADWQMLHREIIAGFVLAGFAAQIPHSVLRGAFLTGSPHAVGVLWSALIGPLIAVASFVCSIGNVPLAAVLWSSGIGFSGVVAFLLADLVILPILAIYRRYYGLGTALAIAGLLLATMIAAAIVVAVAFGGLGWVPAVRPSVGRVVPGVSWDYKVLLNVVALAVFAGLFGLTVRRGASDPVCGMRVDRARALRLTRDGRVYHFCSEHCRAVFAADPEAIVSGRGRAEVAGSARGR
jgi:uncharacterized membrane protein YraQ (UPF0718 family)/YHS domain-containing protein